jgi:hypothetical protein
VKRFLRRHVGLRYGLLVGLVGLVQLAAVAVLMVPNRDAIVSLQRAEVASTQCYDQHLDATTQTVVGLESCPVATVTPRVAEMERAIGFGYLASVSVVFVLYFLAGRAARRSSSRMRSAVGAAFVAAVVGGAIYLLANTVRTVTLFCSFVTRGPLAIGQLTPYEVGLGEEIATLLIFLAGLSQLCALVGPLERCSSSLCRNHEGKLTRQ